MPRIDEAEYRRRISFVIDHYFEFGNDRSKMHTEIQGQLGITIGLRTLRNYYRDAENEILSMGLFDKDKQALQVQLKRSLARYQKIANQAAEDEEKIRKQLKKNKQDLFTNFEAAKTLKDLHYTQMNAEKAIIQMLEKAGITAERKEIDINLRTEEFVLFGQAHMAVAYDLIPIEFREIYTRRCKIFEGADLEALRGVVEGRVPLLKPGAQEEEIHDRDEREEAEREPGGEEDLVLSEDG